MFNTNGRPAAVNNMCYDIGAAGQSVYSIAPVTFGTWPATCPASSSTSATFSLLLAIRHPRHHRAMNVVFSRRALPGSRK